MMCPLPLLVDLVDHRGERRRLAGARRARDEHEAARPLGHLPDDVGQPEVLERLDREGDLPDDHRDAAALLEAVAAEAREVLDAEREIQLVVHLEPLLLVLGEDGVGELHGVLRRHHELEIRVGDLAVDAQLRALAGGDVQIRRVPLDHLLEQDAKVDGGGRLSRSGHGGGYGEPAARRAVAARRIGRDLAVAQPATEDERARPEEHAAAVVRWITPSSRG